MLIWRRTEAKEWTSSVARQGSLPDTATLSTNWRLYCPAKCLLLLPLLRSFLRLIFLFCGPCKNHKYDQEKIMQMQRWWAKKLFQEYHLSVYWSFNPKAPWNKKRRELDVHLALPCLYRSISGIALLAISAPPIAPVNVLKYFKELAPPLM